MGIGSAMAAAKLTVVFDLFGTLLDVASLRDAVEPIAPQPDSFVATWRQKQLGYAFAATSMGAYEDFDGLTFRALEYAAREARVVLTESQKQALVDCWKTMAPFPDAKPCLEDLRAAGMGCDVLTNATVRTSVAALEHAGMLALIDRIHSVDAVRVYKPSPRAYGVVTNHYGRLPGAFVFVTCNGWDATGGAEFGMRVAWCNRLGAPAETFGKPPAWTISSLGELTSMLTAGSRGG